MYVDREDGILAWHFASTTMRDGSTLGAPGTVEAHDGSIELCHSGLHASIDIMDALSYAPGSLLRRVRCYGEVVKSADKLVASRREVLFEVDMEQSLRLFARMVALEIFKKHFLDPRVEAYLMTGEEGLRSAARSAAKSAAEAAHAAAAGSIAGFAAWFAAWSAAGSASKSAARSAAKSAAGSAAEAAAWSAAWSAAGSDAEAAAEAAAGSAARSAHGLLLENLVSAARCGRW